MITEAILKVKCGSPLDLQSRLIACEAVLKMIIEPLLSSLSIERAAKLLDAARTDLKISCLTSDFSEDVLRTNVLDHINDLVDQIEAMHRLGNGENGLAN
jgi:hypothetical protein